MPVTPPVATSSRAASPGASGRPGTFSPGESIRIDATRADPVSVREFRDEIESVVQEMARLAESAVPPAEFFQAFLTRVVSVLGSASGAVWMVRSSGELEAVCQMERTANGLQPGKEQRHHAALLSKAMAGGRTLVIPPRSGSVSEEMGNPSDHLLLVAPLRLQQQPVGVIEVWQRADATLPMQRGYVRFLNQMSDLAADYLKTQRLHELADRQAYWQQLDGFLKTIHRSLRLRPTSYAVVNEGRRLIGCDRLSLAIGTGRSAQITTISGLDSIDRRASEVRRLNLLARAVLRTGEPLWHIGENPEIPPQIDNQLQPYLDLSHARMLAVVPLFPPALDADSPPRRRRPIGALIVEQFSENRPGPKLRSRTETVTQHCAAALAHAIEYDSLPLLALWRILARLGWLLGGGRLLWTLLIATLFCGGIFALATVPADFEVAARGKLQPVVRRDIFARIDGDVVEVPVVHGQMVQPGDLLAKLASNDLAEELQQLLGRQRTNQEQISSTNKRLLDSARGSESRLSPADEARLAGDLLALKQEAENILRELEVFHEQQKRLQVIADQSGQVVTWKVQEQLERRPVVRGQVLMTLAQPDGPWELELYVPERRLKHILAAESEPHEPGDRPPLDVVFALSSHPGAEFHGEVVEIEQTAEVRGEEGNTILARVAVNKEELPHLHDQTTVTARLYCGRRSLGYVWFCDLVETVQSKVLFWL